MVMRALKSLLNLREVIVGGRLLKFLGYEN